MQENLVEKLKRKELPNTNQRNGIRVKISNATENPILEQIGEIPTENEKGLLNEKIGVRIINKTNNVFDRELVLDRLIRHGMITVVENTPKIKISEPFLEENMNNESTSIYSIPIPVIEKEEEKVKEKEKEGEKEGEKVKKIPKRITKKKQIIIPEKNKLIMDLSKVKIGREFIETRIPKRTDKIVVDPPPYYMNNRKLFLKKINELFKNYNKEFMDMSGKVSCKTQQNSQNFELLTHQKVVRDYLNIYSPYRGLLLYHGLGSGKTCTSIAIAEGIKHHKKVFIMTPASLKMNFFSELKKCGDPLYKKNQFWEFVSIEGQPDYPNILSQTLSLPIEYIQKKGGAWLVNIANKPNYTDLTGEEQLHLDEQLNYMIRSKYIDLNYNGMSREKLRILTVDFSKNPFDNSVVVIDEAHNFVSRIVNKIPKSISKKIMDPKKTKIKSISVILYEYLMSAIDVRIVLLTGTPIINYPKEIGVLYNILRGYIKSWTFSINVTTNTKINRDSIIEMLDKSGLRLFDYVEYSGNNLTITRNPYGFINAQKKRKTGGGRITKKKHTKKIKMRNTKKMKKEDLPLYTESNGIISFKSNSLSDIDPNNYSPETKTDSYLPSHMQYTGDNDPHYGGERGIEEIDIKYSKLVGGDGDEIFDNYNGVYLNEAGNISDSVFEQAVLKILSNNHLVVIGKPVITYNKSLPDDGDTFNNVFVNSDVSNEKEPMKNEDLFKRRILGLTSYFRSAQESLLPSYELNKEGGFFHIISNEMSEYQFETYEIIRAKEAEMEKNIKKAMKKKTDTDNDDTIASTYRIFSRAACNFAFPDPPGRPMPSSDKKFAMVEDAFKENIDQEKEDQEDQDKADVEEGEEKNDVEEEGDYNKRIQKAMTEINTPEFLSPEALRKYSPKFASVLQNLADESHIGLHLLYTNFRTIEGVGILRLILLQNGFAEFKLTKDEKGAWSIDENVSDANKPKFVLYTGTETAEEKEIVRNIYNSSWELVPASIVEKLNTNSTDKNLYGKIIKLIMITASGAEGINLKNTRYVHIIEPYWHMVRLEQVIGRARRICSHEDLPEELRTIKVFLYLSTLSADQRTNEKHIELQIRDISRIDGKRIVTTDETLFEMADKKHKINQQILRAVKESAIDCEIYSKGTDLKCYNIGKVESNNFLSNPSWKQDSNEKQDINIQKEKLVLTEVTIQKKKYHLNKNTGELYEHEMVMKAKKTGEELIPIGHLIKDGNRYKIID